jgi:hypothetical protein
MNLCSEEFHLHAEGIVDDRTWRIWVEEMKASFGRKWLRESWAMIAAEYDSFPEFHAFVDRQLELKSDPTSVAA